ncbi:MAG: TetR/AcrR family transcriptional regulator [Bacteroidaceae bacterium]|nr:TetR/AcrR family transcriptional regulator [Bacteroidaceae bacterium]
MKEDGTRENTKRLITETALQQFLEKGIKEVKMDDIASLLSVSKRTIYELFGDKEQLLLESLLLQQKMMRDEAKRIIRDANHILDIILKLYSLYFDKLKMVNSNFFKEIEKYPEICRRSRKREQKNNKKFLAWMEMARKQGLFREDANFEILLYILQRDIEAIIAVKKMDVSNELSKYTLDELGRSLVLFYLRGISTPKGQEIIEEYLKIK